MNRYLLAIVVIAIITWLAMPVPVKQSPLPVVVEPPFLPPTFKAKVKHPARAIFCEPLLGPCYYDDSRQMKVGRNGLKYYEWSDVIVGDEG